ncbi:transcriptional regulator with GAF, ATPase, and Fis domain [Oceanisphaera litoralis]|uniref:helix-turn-helix domain-containing protein n=1 Tax=Oceanisphaera litoralis TaxID=225144 RepID=UPI00195D9042|nr:helix-turn-helix domain-containing protein [Oceanisphaera litoralis]MBM7456110.1 transcriptional regulator with GAF, ATPase, and Fis domain [Oceanisphaera litoralis]
MICLATGERLFGCQFGHPLFGLPAAGPEANHHLPGHGQGADDEDHITRGPRPAPVSLQQATSQAQRRAVEQALSASNNNWAAAARLLDIDPSNLHKLAKRLGMK